MIGATIAVLVGRVIRGMRFPNQGANGAAISRPILETFEMGCRLGLRGVDYGEILRESHCIPWYLRAFLHEGHAMGNGGRSACSFRRRNPEAMMKSTNYMIMRFVGYGFWNGAADTFSLPRLPVRAPWWAEVVRFPKYRLLLSNGYGFASVLFKRKFDRNFKRRVAALDDPEQREAILHGVGRALWFLYLNNFHALRNILDEDEEMTEPLAIGLGLAIAFTQVAMPDSILKTLDHFPESQRNHMVRGAGIALQVHAENDPECKSEIEKSISGQLYDWYEGAIRASSEAGDGSDWYPQYHRKTEQYVLLRPVIESPTS